MVRNLTFENASLSNCCNCLFYRNYAFLYPRKVRSSIEQFSLTTKKETDEAYVFESIKNETWGVVPKKMVSSFSLPSHHSERESVWNGVIITIALLRTIGKVSVLFRRCACSKTANGLTLFILRTLSHCLTRYRASRVERARLLRGSETIQRKECGSTTSCLSPV